MPPKKKPKNIKKTVIEEVPSESESVDDDNYYESFDLLSGDEENIDVDPVLNRTFKFLKSFSMKQATPSVKSKPKLRSSKEDNILQSSGNDSKVTNDVNSNLHEAAVCIQQLLLKFHDLTNTLTRLESTILSIEEKNSNVNNKLHKRIVELENKVNVLENAQQQRINDAAPNAQPSFAEIVKCEKAMTKLTANVNTLRQAKLSCDVYLQGPNVEKALKESQSNDNPGGVCKHLLSQITDLQVTNLNIQRIFCPQNNPNSIRITFGSEDSRSELFKNFFQMDSKPFFINEVLIPEKAKLFYKMRCLRRDLKDKGNDCFKSIFARRGEIYYILASNLNKIEKVTSLDDIKKFSSKLVQTEVASETEQADVQVSETQQAEVNVNA